MSESVEEVPTRATALHLVAVHGVQPLQVAVVSVAVCKATSTEVLVALVAAVSVA